MNTFPEVAFKFFWLFGLPTCLFVHLQFIASRYIQLKWLNITYIGDQEARYCNRKIQFFHEITDLQWAKSLTVYQLICDKGENKAREEYRITQINKDYYFARESINKVSYFVSYEIQSMSTALHCGRQRVFNNILLVYTVYKYISCSISIYGVATNRHVVF